MSALRSMMSGLRALFGKEKRNAELDDEIQGFLDAAAEHRMAQGMSAQDALRAAKMEMSSRDAVKENVWSAGWEAAVDNFWQDLRYSVRMLLKSPGFTLVAVASLALGIGANTAIFTLINDLLLKSLPVRDPQQLVSFGKAFGGGQVDGIGAADFPLDIFTYDFYQRLQKEQAEGRAPFNGICGFASFWTQVSVRSGTSAGGPGSEAATQAAGHLVTGDFFTVLGAEPLLGRTLTPADADAPGRSPVAVISYRYWQQMFAGDPAIVGRTITINGTLFTVIGVMPPKFDGVALDTQSMDMWLPITMQREVMLQPSLIDPHGLYWMHMMGRRKPGIPVAQAQAWVASQLQSFMIDREGAQVTPARKQELQKAYVELLPGGSGISNLREIYQQPLNILMGVVALVLLIACANLANFLLAKAASREREIATRLALGSSRRRIMRQILMEALLLSFAGGALGMALAYLGTRALIQFIAAGAKHTPLEARPDLHVLLFTLVVCLVDGNSFRHRASATGVADQRRSFAGSERAHGREQRRVLAADCTPVAGGVAGNAFADAAGGCRAIPADAAQSRKPGLRIRPAQCAAGEIQREVCGLQAGAAKCAVRTDGGQVQGAAGREGSERFRAAGSDRRQLEFSHPRSRA